MSARKARKATRKMLDTSPVLNEKEKFMSLSYPRLHSFLQAGAPLAGASVGASMVSDDG